jgi:hypothetical protein
VIWQTSLSACSNAPKVTICLSDPPAYGMQCSDGSDLTPEQKQKIKAYLSEGKKEVTASLVKRDIEFVEYLKSLGTFLPYEDSGNYVCMSPEDARKFFEFCRNK